MSDKKKLESTFLNMFIVLTVISLVSAFAIGLAFYLTNDQAEKVKKDKFDNAVKSVVPDFDELEAKREIEIDGDKLALYRAKKGGAVVGTAVETISHKGFGGDVLLLVGFDGNGNIHNSSILSIKETPGLGSNMDTPKFKDQINGKNPDSFKLKVKKDGGDIDAITAATISSRAFSDAVSKAVRAYKSASAQ